MDHASGPLRSFAKIVVWFLAVIGGVAILVTATPILSWWARLLAGPWNDPQGDVLIVLSGDPNNAEIIGRSSYWRCVYAAWAWKGGGFRRVLISGEEASTLPMVNFLVFSGVPRDAVSVEPRSTSTRENALFTARMLGPEHPTAVLLTSDYHMFRSRRAFAKAGLEVRPRPIPDALKRAQSWQNRPEVFIDLAVESVKIVWYARHGWI